jgi:hypothetical protein
MPLLPPHCTKDVYTPQGSTRDLWTAVLTRFLRSVVIFFLLMENKGMPLHSQAFYVPVTVVLLNIHRCPIITFFVSYSSCTALRMSSVCRRTVRVMTLPGIFHNCILLRHYIKCNVRKPFKLNGYDFYHIVVSRHLSLFSLCFS